MDSPHILLCEGHGDHWSDLIGASHTKDYTIWKYGGYASLGVQRVAEWGSPTTLERELLAQVRYWDLSDGPISLSCSRNKCLTTFVC